MRIVEKYSTQFENRIRVEMSPMSISDGKVTTHVPYKGDVTLERYLARVPINSNDQIVPYLVLKECDPLLSDKVAAFLEAVHQKEEACAKQDFEKGAKIRDDERRLRRGLLRLINKK